MRNKYRLGNHGATPADTHASRSPAPVVGLAAAFGGLDEFRDLTSRAAFASAGLEGGIDVLRRGFRSTRMIAVICGVIMTAGCSRSGGAASGGAPVIVTSWTATDPLKHVVPGRAVAAWKGPSGGVLVLYRTLAIPGGTSPEAAQAFATRIENLPGLKVVDWSAKTVAGESVARVDVVGPGTGDVLAPSSTGKAVAPAGQSLVPTRLVTVFIVRPETTWQLAWTVPEARFEALAAEIQSTVDSLRFPPSGTLWQSYKS